MKLTYEKLHGCQNDYLFFDFAFGEQKLSETLDLPSLSQKYSNRENSIGADGLIALLPAESGGDVAMKIFNADGSEAEICGNGIRCVAMLADQKLGSKDAYVVETAAGSRECQILKRESPEKYQVRVNMGRPSFIPAKIPVLFDDVMCINEEFDVDDKVFMVSCVSIGNPHCVIEVKDLENFDVGRYGPQIEKHEAFPEGTNVEFVELKGDEVFQRTWERGSGETKACGSGACAAGVTLVMRNRIDSPVPIHLRGGDLSIEWDGLREVWMTGEAVLDSKGEVEV